MTEHRIRHGCAKGARSSIWKHNCPIGYLGCPQSPKTAMEASALLGRRTAEMHLALSCSSSDPAFAPEPCSQKDLEKDAGQIETQIRSALEALKAKFSGAR